MAVVIAGSTVGLVLASEVVFLWAFHRRKQVIAELITTSMTMSSRHRLLYLIQSSHPSYHHHLPPARTTSIDSTTESLPSVVPPPTDVPHPIPTPSYHHHHPLHGPSRLSHPTPKGHYLSHLERIRRTDRAATTGGFGSEKSYHVHA